jgi:hypothetical protein
LRLPAELRSKIYQYALGGHDLRQPWEFSDQGHWRIRSSRATIAQFTWKPNLLGLLSVCRQIYAECKRIPFSSNIFHFRPCLTSNHIQVVRGALNKRQKEAIENIRVLYIFAAFLADLTERKAAEHHVQLTGLPGLKRIYVGPPDALNTFSKEIKNLHAIEHGLRYWIPNQNYEIIHEEETAGVHPSTGSG